MMLRYYHNLNISNRTRCYCFMTVSSLDVAVQIHVIVLCIFLNILLEDTESLATLQVYIFAFYISGTVNNYKYMLKE